MKVALSPPVLGKAYVRCSKLFAARFPTFEACHDLSHVPRDHLTTDTREWGPQTEARESVGGNSILVDEEAEAWPGSTTDP